MYSLWHSTQTENLGVQINTKRSWCHFATVSMWWCNATCDCILLIVIDCMNIQEDMRRGEDLSAAGTLKGRNRNPMNMCVKPRVPKQTMRESNSLGEQLWRARKSSLGKNFDESWSANYSKRMINWTQSKRLQARYQKSRLIPYSHWRWRRILGRCQWRISARRPRVGCQMYRDCIGTSWRSLRNCTNVYTEPPHRTRTHAHFSRANTTAHHPHTSSVGTPHWLKAQCSRSKWVARHSQCFKSISFRDVVVKCSLSSVSACSVLALCTVIKTLSVYHTHCKRSAQQPKAPARWSESGRMADSAPNTHRLWAQARQLLQLRGSGAHADQYPWQPPQFPVPRRRHHDSPPVQKFYRIQEHPAASKQQLAQFHHCWDPPVPGNRVHVMCRVVLASRKLGQSWTEICCSNVL